MKLKDLIAQYGEYEIDSKCVVGECEIERIVIDLTKPKPKSVWELKSGDKYFILYSDGVVTEYEWRENGNISKSYRDQGNIFLTKEEAERDLERRKVETLLLKYGGRRWFKDDSGTGEEMNWYIFYGYDVSVGWGGTRQGTIYFDTKEQAEKAISEIGEERIRKALFEVR